ncbi:MAG: leucine-rich repeat protein [Firmicutes bacterium]|nr:leucine-rich repeat protein [Bacillota bacterium]
MNWVESEFVGCAPYVFDGTAQQEVNKTYVYIEKSNESPESWFSWSGNTIVGLTGKYENGSLVYDENCGYLQRIYVIPKRCTAIGSFFASMVENVDTGVIAQDIYSTPRGINNVYIPDTVITIDRAAFAYTRSLITIRLPNNLTSINFAMFASGSAAANGFVIPHKVREIQQGAFAMGAASIKLKFIRDSSYTGQISITNELLSSAMSARITELHFTCSQSEANNLFNWGSNTPFTQSQFASAAKYYNQTITND